MSMFDVRDTLIRDYEEYIRSFIHIRDQRIQTYVDDSLASGLLWPAPLIQLNPSFARGASIDTLVDQGVLAPECGRVFRKKSSANDVGQSLTLHRHQEDAVRVARTGASYVLTTGTGSGKSLAYIIPIVDHVLRLRATLDRTRRISAIVVYPMNALANSQLGELQKFLEFGYPDGGSPVTFQRYTGQESDEAKMAIIANPPDILLTNYAMLELLLTRPQEKSLIDSAHGLPFLVLDELHTYRGRQGADVALLVRRLRERVESPSMQCVGTSATLAGVGSLAEQQEQVAAMASRLFGVTVAPAHVIGETLQRTTDQRDVDDPAFRRVLTSRLTDPAQLPSTAFAHFVADPLVIWIESTLGLGTDASGRLVRARPLSITGHDGAAARLSQQTGVPEQECADAIAHTLLAGYQGEPNPATGRPAFAFRLHQFISRGETVHASIDRAADRYITLHPQRFVPGDRGRVLLPLVFCRDCGQDYYCVRQRLDAEQHATLFPSQLRDHRSDEHAEALYLYLNDANPWPDEPTALLDRVPDDWLEMHNGAVRLRPSLRKKLPRPITLTRDGREAAQGADEDETVHGHLVLAPFRFCLNCGVSYRANQRSEIGKLAILGMDGRSTATTITSLSVVQSLRQDENMPPHARKLLSFTDNRQDASLQAGHLNDFVEIGQLRSAIYRAVAAAPADTGLRDDTLVQRVMAALDLPITQYAVAPDVRFAAREETDRALRSVLGYLIYHDLKRGWRVTSPNLEQTGQLVIDYLSLGDVCAAEDIWAAAHPALAHATPQIRATVARVLLDLMRRELAIKVHELNPLEQEKINQQSDQRLISPWAIDENDRLESAVLLYPSPKKEVDDDGRNLYLSARSDFGQYLRRRSTFPHHHQLLTMADTDAVIVDLLAALRQGGLVEVVDGGAGAPLSTCGFQLPAAALIWRKGDGTTAYYDPIRVPTPSQDGGRTNPFFVRFYGDTAARLRGMEAREHTAQVPYAEREQREESFRAGTLPILYCSPTMELGVDIAELNVVNMRNVPPTPANYAQRSGRAGRSGQPALVFSYCSTGSPHDQYFFKRPYLMVAGSVTPPRLDLANEDLVRAHVHSVWLAETGFSLGRSLTDILDVSGDTPTLNLRDEVLKELESSAPRQRARQRAARILETMSDDLAASTWYSPLWLDSVLTNVPQAFHAACDRWRDLYRAARAQAQAQDRIIRDAARSVPDKNEAKRLRTEAENQLALLTEAENLTQSDFYSYRYFASEGFLPGYSFPRLPLSAFIPARRRNQRDEFLSRPRFLAVSEFGPRAIIYHEGSRYMINKIILPVRATSTGESQDILPTARVKQCAGCGYIHVIGEGDGPDLCEFCATPLGIPLRQLLRQQNVATKRRDRITSDEEERLRQGYEIRTGVRFVDRDGLPSYTTATVSLRGTDLYRLTFGNAATLWRINMGWTRRKEKQQFGFLLDVERGFWARNENEDAEESDDQLSPRKERVIPYVEDHRNCLLITPLATLASAAMASLQAALKTAIQTIYQLEDSEISAEPLPTPEHRHHLLLFESAEGGAGVLQRLLQEPDALPSVARAALALCHFDPDPATAADLRRAEHAREDCEAACYDCLMTYRNQYDHGLLDRQVLLPLLRDLAQARVVASPTAQPAADHLDELRRLTQSHLERQWLTTLHEQGRRLPSHAQALIEACSTRPDFFYNVDYAAIYIDGPHHDQPHRQARDQAQQECLEDAGYIVIRFSTQPNEWSATFDRYPSIFGTRQRP